MTGADTPTIGPRIGLEIERKFLLRRSDGSAVAGLVGLPLLQGYFRDLDGWSVRLRLAGATVDDSTAWLTLKSRDKSALRWEVESPVAPDFAGRLLGLLPADRKIEKIRYRRPVDGSPALVWEIDRFLGRHDGLWLAEIELPRADHLLELPDWLGAEVTSDPRYRNAALAAPADGEDSPLPAELEQVARRLLGTVGAAEPPVVPEPPRHGPRHAGREAERRLRQARLERELRANLLRRKQQHRGRDAGLADPDSGAGLDRDDPAK